MMISNNTIVDNAGRSASTSTGARPTLLVGNIIAFNTGPTYGNLTG